MSLQHIFPMLEEAPEFLWVLPDFSGKSDRKVFEADLRPITLHSARHEGRPA